MSDTEFSKLQYLIVDYHEIPNHLSVEKTNRYGVFIIRDVKTKQLVERGNFDKCAGVLVGYRWGIGLATD